MPKLVRHGVSGTVVPEIRVEVGRHDFPRTRLRFRGLARPGRARLRRDEHRGLGDHVPVGNTGTRDGGNRVTIAPHWRMWSARFAHSLLLSTSIIKSLQLGPVIFCYISCNIRGIKMIEIPGKYCTAKVYTDNIEEAAFKQIMNLMNQPFAAGSDCAIMPDCHAGVGCVIGLTAKITDKVVPNLVGVDISCGMLVVKVGKGVPIDLKQVDKIMHRDIPSGMNHRSTKHRYADRVALDEMLAPVNVEKLKLSIGTLGGGNHFVEINVDSEGNHYFVIHSGSRHLGIEVCRYYQDLAVKYHRNDRTALQDAIKKLKHEGREREIEETIQKMNADRPSVPNELAYLEGPLMTDYLHDMKIAQEFACCNREAMMEVLLDGLGIRPRDILAKFCTLHNYIDLEQKILRKGSISLLKGERAIIPMNMRDGSLIVEGKGNPDWNYSGPHGAGRLMSRSKAKETLRMEDFKASMEGIYTTCVSTGTIDESPMAYKPYEEIMANIEPTATIIERIKPIYNFKASEA